MGGRPGDQPPGLLGVAARGDQAQPTLARPAAQSCGELVVGHDLIDRPDLAPGLGSILDQVLDRAQRLGVARRRPARLHPRARALLFQQSSPDGARYGRVRNVIGRMLGHAKVRSSERYGHLSDKFLIDAADKATAVINLGTGRKPSDAA